MSWSECNYIMLIYAFIIAFAFMHLLANSFKYLLYKLNICLIKELKCV